ncbi:MAG: putative ABC exporter domain-containing protein [Candidatus Lustribacter sp.]
MTTLGALFYADVRSLVNQLREIRRAPGRSVVWVLFVLFVAGLIGFRIYNASHRAHFGRHIVAGAGMLDLMACFAIALLGAALAFGGRYAGLFAHPAEARFIIDSPAQPFVATLYVQVRQIVRGSARQALGLLYMAVIYLPQTLPAASLVRDLVLIGVAFAFIAAVPLARQLLSPRLAPFAFAAGAACLAAAVAVALRAGASALSTTVPAAGALARHLPAWHPGAIFTAGAPGGDATIAAMLVCTGALFAYVAQRARDAYPELYELSMKRLARVERLRARSFGLAARAPQTPVHRTAAAGPAPAGVAIFIWRAWTEYRRTNSVRATSIETATCLIAGYAVARIAQVTRPEMLVTFASSVLNIAFIIAVMRSATLATELRRPLFWLSGATLFERLCALGLAQSWRLIGWLVLGGIGLAAGGASAPVVVAALIVAPCGAALALAIGYASYALLPYEADQRGPLLFVRLLLGYVLIVPPIVAGIAIAALERITLTGLIAASVIALLEAGVLLGFASWRLDRMSISLR